MGKSLFVLTQKDLAKLSVIMLLAVIFFGLTGLIIMLFFQWITLRSYAADAADKHGISQVSASRLGGLAIFISWVGLMLAGYYNGYLGGKSGGPVGPYWIDWFAVGFCVFLGLAEDLRNNMLSPRFRLYAELAIFAITIGFWPVLIPTNLGFLGMTL